MAGNCKTERSHRVLTPEGKKSENQQEHEFYLAYRLRASDLHIISVLRIRINTIFGSGSKMLLNSMRILSRQSC